MTEKRINLDVNSTVWKEISVYAAENDQTKKEVVNKALKDFLEKEDKQ